MIVNKITTNQKEYPDQLRNIASPPKALFCVGDMAPLAKKPIVSIVGSRAVTPYGKQVTIKLARELASRGIAIVSGLALGVDALAHQAALEAGGYTAAVLPSSVEQVYPATNRQLAKRIIDQGGALLSEYNGPMESFKSNFIARNRLVSGLAGVLLITEASERSGTLHTANFALEQGRTVMAVPGNITSPASAGTNNLIKAGALPATDVSDILTALGLDGRQEHVEILAANPEEEVLLTLLKSGMTDSSLLLAESNLASSVFNQTLTMLEITGKIKPLGSGHWGLK